MPTNHPTVLNLSRTQAIVVLGTALAYAFRDGLSAIFRWLTLISGTGPAWFLVDAFGAVCVGIFAYELGYKRGNWLAITTLSILAFAVGIGSQLVDSNLVWLMSGLKMYFPLFVGWLLADFSAQNKIFRNGMLGLCVISIIGLFLDQFFEFPWEGLSISQFGQEKELARQWWIGERERVAGFGGVSAASAKIALFSYVFIHRTLRPASSLLLLLGVIVACEVATNRTTMAIAMVLFVYIFAESYLAEGLRDVRSHRIFAMASFLVIPLPLILMAVIGPLDLAAYDFRLASLETRIETSWFAPFTILMERQPAALLFGCGTGCFTGAMNYTSWGLFIVPIDHFYIILISNLGLAGLIVIAALFMSTLDETDRSKLLLLVAFNLTGLMTENFSPNLCLISLGYATSRILAWQWGVPKTEIVRL